MTTFPAIDTPRAQSWGASGEIASPIVPAQRLPSPVAGVAIWRVDLDRADPDRAARVISPDERRVAERRHRPLDRQRYVAAHAALRHLLASSLAAVAGTPSMAHADAEGLAFEVGAHGKPALADHPGVAFNMSHADGTALIALALAGPPQGGQDTLPLAVGIDLERRHTLSDAAALARSILSPGEQAALDAALPQPGQHASRAAIPRDRPTSALDLAVLHAWTAKEAVLKCLGVGLSWPAASLDLGPAVLAPHAGALAWQAGADAGVLWRLDVGSDHVAALAVGGREGRP